MHCLTIHAWMCPYLVSGLDSIGLALFVEEHLIHTLSNISKLSRTVLGDMHLVEHEGSAVNGTETRESLR